MRLRWSVAAIALCLSGARADDDVQALVQKAQSGQKLSAEEMQQVRQYYVNQAQQLRSGAGTPAMSDDAWKLLEKKKKGQPLTPDEQQQLRDEMVKGGLAKLPDGGTPPKENPSLDGGRRGQP